MLKPQENTILSYQVNQKPELDKQDIIVILNVSHPDNVEALFEYAVEKARAENRKLLCVYSDYKSSMNNHSKNLMLDRINEMKNQYSGKVSLQLVIKEKFPPQLVKEHQEKASIVVSDTGRINPEKLWRHQVARNVPCKMVRIERKRDPAGFRLEKVLNADIQVDVPIEDLREWCEITAKKM